MTQVLPPPSAAAPPLYAFGLEIKTTKYGGLISMTKADYEALKETIRKDRKLVYPIIINQKGDVLDGHNRLQIRQELAELGIIVEDLRFEIKHFENDLEEERFVRIVNVNRRHMNAYQKAKQGLALEPIEAELARQRELAGKTLGPNEPRGRVKEIVSKAVNLPPTTYFRAKTIIPKVSPELDRRLEEGRAEITTEYNKIVRAEKRTRAREEAEAFAKDRNLPEKVTVLNKDSTKIEELREIPDNSVDVIITDPPYNKGDLPMFEALAKLAVRKLKEGGSLIFYFGQPHLEELIIMLSKYKSEGGLFYQWPVAVIHTGSQARFHCLGLEVGWKPMLWYKKRKKGDERYDNHKPAWQPDFCDVIYSKPPDKDQHEWAQSPVEAEKLISSLTISEHSLVVDPFLGSGAFGIAAARLNRYFIGIDIDKETCDHARNHIIKATAIAE